MKTKMTKMKYLSKIAIFLFTSLFTFAAVPYSGSAFTASIATDGTTQTLINNIETALLGGGWTTVSGHATTNLLMASGTTPQSLQIYVRFKYTSGANIQVYIESTDGTLHSTYAVNAGASLQPTAGINYTVVGSHYQFIIYSQNISTYGQYVWVGMPYLNTALAANLTRVGWLFSNNGGSSTTNSAHLSQQLTVMGGSIENSEYMTNGVFWEEIAPSGRGPNVAVGGGRFIINGVNADLNATQSTATGYRWRTATPSVLTGDVFVAWGLTVDTDEAMINGQVWDCVYIADSQPINTTATFDGHNWINLTNSNPGTNGTYVRGGLWCATN